MFSYSLVPENRYEIRQSILFEILQHRPNENLFVIQRSFYKQSYLAQPSQNKINNIT